jgi:hypothetical protein
MTVSLKLKLEEKEKLYYNKYSYKAVCRVLGAYYTNSIKTIDEYKDKVESLQTELKRWPVHTYPHGLDNLDYIDIDNLIRYIGRFEKNDKGTIRREGNTISFFSNDLAFLKKAPSTLSPLKITQVSLAPAGVKYFKRKVPAPFRVHLKEARVNTELRQDIFDYINKTDGVEGSGALMIWLTRTSRWPQVWCSKSFYINYADSGQLTMMHILFSEVIGKNYKLEQK